LYNPKEINYSFVSYLKNISNNNKISTDVKACLKICRYSVISQWEFLVAAKGFAMGQQETTFRSTSETVGITVSIFAKDTGIV